MKTPAVRTMGRVILTTGVFAPLIAALVGCCTSYAAPTASYKPLSASFTPIVVPDPIREPIGPPRGPEPPTDPVPVPSPIPVPIRPVDPRPPDHERVVRGTATWYCCTRGYGSGAMVAAAGSELRRALGKHWRGRVVTVVYRGRSIRVTVVDWCACKGQRVIDLHPGAFGRLGPLSRGVLHVRVVIR